MVFDSADNLWVIDTDNNRVLEFLPPLESNQNASIVIGQSNFNSSSAPTPPTQSSLALPRGATFDPSGDLWVADGFSCRVVEFVPTGTPPVFTNGQNASVVIGQPDFTSDGCGVTQASLKVPDAVAFDASGDLWVGDLNNNRVLEFEPTGTPPAFTNGQNASVVIGQANFTSGGTGLSQSRLDTEDAATVGLAFDGSGDLWVADSSNNRVLEFVPSGTPPVFTIGQNASVVLGQTDFIDNNFATSQNGLHGPSGIAFDGSGNLWVSDSNNSRLLEFVPSGTPPLFTTNQNATLVLGQADFTHGGGATSQNGFDFPLGISFAP